MNKEMKTKSGMIKKSLLKYAFIIPMLVGSTLFVNAQDTKKNEQFEVKVTPANSSEAKVDIAPEYNKSIEIKIDDSKTKISFEKTVHEFGTIKEADGKVEAVFTFRNNGNKPLVINNVIPSCGCTVSSWTKEPVQPGSNGTITATYDPTGRVTPFDKILTVVSNTNPERTTLHIRGTVTQ